MPDIEWEVVARRLADARRHTGLTQEDVAIHLGVNRVVVSYWETGARHPDAAPLASLARLYGTSLRSLVEGTEPEEHALPELVFRDLPEELDSEARLGIRSFLNFLDRSAALLEHLGRDLPGPGRSSLNPVTGRTSKDEIRRLAMKVRSRHDLGLGPVPNLQALLDIDHVIVYRAPLGSDLATTLSGAFVNHPRVGFAILVNQDTSQGRQLFTLAHEYAHCLFHSQLTNRILCRAFDRDERERFADYFAGQFLVPSDALALATRAVPHLTPAREAAQVVFLQRIFHVSYATMLVRLRQESYVNAQMYDRLAAVRPVMLAASLGYPVSEDEWGRRTPVSVLERYPASFLQLIRQAVHEDRISVGVAAELCEVSQEEMIEFLEEPREVSPEQELQHRELAGALQ